MMPFVEFIQSIRNSVIAYDMPPRLIVNHTRRNYEVCWIRIQIDSYLWLVFFFVQRDRDRVGNGTNDKQKMVYIAFTHRLYAYVFEQIIKSSLHSQCKLIIPYLALIALRNSPLFSFLSSRWLTKITRPFIFTRLFVDFHFFLLIIRVHISHNLCSWCAHTRTHRVLFVLHI